MVKVNIGPHDIDGAKSWCNAMLGSRILFDHHNGQWCRYFVPKAGLTLDHYGWIYTFKNPDHAVLFTLRWA